MATDDTDQPIPESRTTSGMGPERGRKSLLRTRFEDVKDTALENAMGKGESWARKVGSGDAGVKLDDFPKLCAALNLKIVSIERICITPAQKARYDALEVIAAQALNPSLDQGSFDE